MSVRLPPLSTLAMPKSSTFTRSVGEEDVVGLEVAVDDALRVRGGETVGDAAPMRSAARSPSGPATEHGRQAVALEQLHHEVEAAVGVLAEVDDLDDVGVRDVAGGLGLLKEALR